MTIHFKFEIIPAGRWSRLEGTTPQGGDNEPRPHLVPVTDAGRSLIAIDATGFIGNTGLCPGEITLEDGSREYAYRFLNLSDNEAGRLIADLSGEIDKLRKAAE